MPSLNYPLQFVKSVVLNVKMGWDNVKHMLSLQTAGVDTACLFILVIDLWQFEQRNTLGPPLVATQAKWHNSMLFWARGQMLWLVHLELWSKEALGHTVFSIYCLSSVPSTLSSIVLDAQYFF